MDKGINNAIHTITTDNIMEDGVAKVI